MFRKKKTIEDLAITPTAADSEGIAEDVVATETRKPSKLLLVLAAMGPGIVAAMAGNDAGGISTYSTAGAEFGFATLWLSPSCAFCLSWWR